MSVKPVDLQASLPKSLEVGKLAKMKQDEGQARLTEVATAFKGEMDRLQRQVHTPAKPEGARIERDKKGGKQGNTNDRDGEQAAGDREATGDQEVAGGADPRKGGIIDMLL